MPGRGADAGWGRESALAGCAPEQGDRECRALHLGCNWDASGICRFK